MKKIAFLLVMLFAISATVAGASPSTHKLVLRRVAASDIGKPGSDLSIYTDSVMIDRILSMGSSRRRAQESPTSSTALVKDATNKNIMLNGHLNKSVIVEKLMYKSGKTIVAPFAYEVNEEGDWYVPVWENYVPLLFSLNEVPTLEVRVFDTTTGDLTVLAVDMNFYGTPETGGIGDVRLDGPTIKIVGHFAPDAHVRVNGMAIDEKTLTRNSAGIDVSIFSSSSGEQIFYPGVNLVTVVSSGICDTYAYRYNPNQ